MILELMKSGYLYMKCLNNLRRDSNGILMKELDQIKWKQNKKLRNSWNNSTKHICVAPKVNHKFNILII